MHYLRRNAGKPILLVPRDVTRTKCSTWAAAAAIRHGIAWMDHGARDRCIYMCAASKIT
jgi:uncharacterized ferritin-like protein (DUF455 family)